MSEEDKLLTSECLYSECKDAFLNEWDRKKSLENTANIYLSVYSIILGFGLLKADEIGILFGKAFIKSSIFGNIVFTSAFLLLYCVIRGLWMTIKAIQLQEYGTFPDPNELLDSMKDKSKSVYLKSLSNYFARQVKRNEKENNKKAEALKDSFAFIMITVVCVGTIIVSIISFKIIGG